MLWLYELIPDVALKRGAAEAGDSACLPAVPTLALQVPSTASWRIPSFDTSLVKVVKYHRALCFKSP